jgi:hypothetical protein
MQGDGDPRQKRTQDAVPYLLGGGLTRPRFVMTEAIDRLEEIDPLTCRESVASRHDVAIIAERYAVGYCRAIRAAAEGRRRLTHRAQRAHPPARWPSRPSPPRATLA